TAAPISDPKKAIFQYSSSPPGSATSPTRISPANPSAATSTPTTRSLSSPPRKPGPTASGSPQTITNPIRRVQKFNSHCRLATGNWQLITAFSRALRQLSQARLCAFAKLLSFLAIAYGTPSDRRSCNCSHHRVEQHPRCPRSHTPQHRPPPKLNRLPPLATS